MADEKDDLLSPEEIEALFESARGQAAAAAPPPPLGKPAPAAEASRDTAEPPPALLQPDDISELIRQHAAGQRSRPREPSASGSSTAAGPTSKAADALLQEMEANLAAAVRAEPPGSAPPELDSATPFGFREFDIPGGEAVDRMGLDALEDVELDVRIELGRAEMLIEEVLKLREGSVVPLDKLAGDPVDILVNGRLIARGEVLVLNDNFCVRVAEILNADV